MIVSIFRRNIRKVKVLFPKEICGNPIIVSILVLTPITQIFSVNLSETELKQKQRQRQKKAKAIYFLLKGSQQKLIGKI